jgi:hypothetical protein
MEEEISSRCYRYVCSLCGHPHERWLHCSLYDLSVSVVRLGELSLCFGNVLVPHWEEGRREIIIIAKAFTDVENFLGVMDFEMR